MQRTPTCQNCCRNLVYKDSSRPNVQRIPLLLKCGHTYCDACVNKWARQLRTHVVCPECQVVTPIKEGEFPVKSISPNLYQLGVLTAIRKTALESDCKRPNRNKGSGKIVQKALSQFSNQRKAAQLKAEGGATCLKCEECFIAVASSRCPKCESVFCQPCFDKVHVSSNILRKHKPVPLSSTSDVVPGCLEHDNRPYEFYDKTVNQPVCSHCVVIGDRQGHDIVPATEVTVSLQDEFKTSVEASKRVLSHLQKSEQQICKCIPMVNTEKTQVVNSIREHFQKLHAALQAREEHLIKQVDEREDGKNSMEMMRQVVAESIKRSSIYIQEVEYILDDPLKLIAKTKQLSTQLEEMREIPCCAVKLPQQSDKERVIYDENLAELISSYGTVATDGQHRFTMKKLSEVTEEDLKDSEEQPSPEEGTEDSVGTNADAAAGAVSGTSRIRVASKLLHIPYRHELVRVTHISDPCHFVVQRLADLEQLNVIMKAINVSCEQSDDPSDLFFEVQVGTVCCCQFTVDNQWYRARVVNVLSPSNPTRYPTLENGLCVEVTYIDYGNNEWIPVSRLRKLKNKFLEVAELGVPCSLVDIVPPFEEDKWPSKAIKAFGSLTGEKPLLMTVSDRVGGKLYVDLRTPEDDEPTQDNDRPASVRDALVFLEVARFTSPASRPTQGGQLFVPTRNFKEAAATEKDSFVDVLVTHVVNPEEIFLHKIQADETLELDRIMNEMSRMFSGSRSKDQWMVPWPYRGLVCGARFSEDGVWYRALINAVHSDETVDVSYVDFGNSETRPFSEIRKLPDMFLTLPKQAICACLADVKPCGEATEWSEEVKTRLSMMLMNKSMIIKALGCEGSKTAVLLYDTSHSYDVCINDLMVQNSLAEPAGMGLVKTREEQLEAAKIELPEIPLQSEVEEKPDAVVTQETTEPAQSNSGSVPDPSPSHFAQYVPPDLPQQRRFLLGVTFVDDDGFIYGQEMKQGDRTLIEVMSDLQRLELTDIPDNNFRLAPGLPCCALYADDGMWYRAKVINLCQDGKVLVNYIDFGNSEAVELEALRLETPFMHVPQQCLQLVLHGIEPNTTDGRWPAEALKMLTQLIIGAECLATIKSERLPGSPFLVVKLALADGIDVTSWMLSKGLGRACIPKAPSGGLREREVEILASQDQPPLSAKAQAKAITKREVNNMLTHTKLPELGVEFDVTVTQIDQPDCVFVQRVPPLEDEVGLAEDEDPTVDDAAAELQELEDMALRINRPEYFKKLLPLATAWEGMLCCGNYTQDDMWYRAEVLSVECEKPLECRVLYIDYGTSEIIKGDRLRGFPSILLDLPRQAVRCRIGDVLPPLNYKGQLLEGTKWPVDAMEHLIELVAGKKLIAKILCRGPPVCIALYERITLDDGSTQDISVGKQLAEQRLALHLGPDQPSDVDELEVTPEKKSEESNDSGKEESKRAKTFEFVDNESRLPFFKEEETKHSAAGAEAAAAVLEKILAPPPKVGFASTPATKLLTPSQIVGKKSHARSDSPRRISANIGLPATREEENGKRTAETQDGNRSNVEITRNEEENSKNTVGVQEEVVLGAGSGSDTGTGSGTGSGTGTSCSSGSGTVTDAGNNALLSKNQQETVCEAKNVLKEEESTKIGDGEDMEENPIPRMATTEKGYDSGKDIKQKEEAPDESCMTEPCGVETVASEVKVQGGQGVNSSEGRRTGEVDEEGSIQGGGEESKTGSVNEDSVESAV